MVSELDGEIVVLCLATGRYHSLNETAALIWRLVNQHGRLGPVVDSMEASLDVPRERLETDVRRAVEELIELGLLSYEE